MVYLAIKELSNSAEDVIMVTSSILKDMQSNQDAVYRPNAIRALCKIIDVRLLTVFNSLLLTFFTARHGSIRRTLL
jgi:coatomer protein complex subunit gamma